MKTKLILIWLTVYIWAIVLGVLLGKAIHSRLHNESLRVEFVK